MDDKELTEKVKAVLEYIRPALRMDGGDVELVEVKDGRVLVRLTGACSSCELSQITLQMGIEEALIEAIPEIKEVFAVK